VGQVVRVALVTESAIRKQTFRKRIMNNWSRDIFQIYAVSDPDAAGAQPQYLLKNLTTHRKSRKKYWSYQLQPVPISAEQPEGGDQAESEDEEQGPEEPEPDRYLPQPQPQQPRRSARAWQPSQEGLRSFAAR